jgi:hypothetical protein
VRWLAVRYVVAVVGLVAEHHGDGQRHRFVVVDGAAVIDAVAAPWRKLAVSILAHSSVTPAFGEFSGMTHMRPGLLGPCMLPNPFGKQAAFQVDVPLLNKYCYQ